MKRYAEIEALQNDPAFPYGVSQYIVSALVMCLET